MAKRGQGGFEDLECYQLALQVLQEAYHVASLLPPEERYNLADPIRRAATSVVLNIAEGYGRYHYLDSLRFYYGRTSNVRIARGSLDETLSGFIACSELGYTDADLPRQRDLCHSALRSLNGYIRYVRKQRRGRQEYGEKSVREDNPLYVADFEPSMDG